SPTVGVVMAAPIRAPANSGPDWPVGVSGVAAVGAADRAPPGVSPELGVVGATTAPSSDVLVITTVGPSTGFGASGVGSGVGAGVLASGVGSGGGAGGLASGGGSGGWGVGCGCWCWGWGAGFGCGFWCWGWGGGFGCGFWCWGWGAGFGCFFARDERAVVWSHGEVWAAGVGSAGEEQHAKQSQYHQTQI